MVLRNGAAAGGFSLVTRLCGWALGGLLLAGFCGCQAEPVPVNDESLKGTRYLRYTLRGEPAGLTTQAYRSNYLSYRVFKPAGSKVDISSYTDRWVDLSFNGIPCRMYYVDVPFPTAPEGIRAFVEKHFAATSEELGLDMMDKDIRQQVDLGNPAYQMTKDQVFLALGYPCQIDNGVVADDLTRDQIFASNQWTYRFSQVAFVVTLYTYRFDNDGKFVQRIP